MATPQDMVEAINTCLKLDDDFELDEWEEGFFINIEQRLKNRRPLTSTQLGKLEEIYDRT